MMNNIVRFELKKIYQNKRVCIILLFCFIVNAFLFLYLDREFNSNYYKSVKKDIAENKDYFISQYESDYSNEYTLDIILDEYVLCHRVSLYIDYIQQNADNNIDIAIFSDTDFSKRNIIKTKEDYAKLNHINVEFGGTYGISKALDFYVTDICIFVLIIVSVYYIFIDEHKTEIKYITSSTKCGRTVKCVSQWCAVAMITIGIVILFYLGNIIISFIYTGQVDMSLPIQVLFGYDKAFLNITIGEYIVHFFIVKSINSVLVASVIFLIAVITKDELLFYFGIVSVFALNYIMNNVRNLWGINEYLRYSNLLYIFDTTGYYKNYYNLDFFDYPISHNFFGIWFSVVIIIMALSYSCMVYIKERKLPLVKIIKEKVTNKVNIRLHSTRIFLYEVKKGFIGNKLLFAIAIIGLVASLCYFKSEKSLTSKETFYLYYVNASYGMSSEELCNMNMREQASIDGYKQYIKGAEKEYRDGKLAEEEFFLIRDYYNQQLQCESGFQEWQKQYSYVVDYNKKNSETLYMINSLGWEKAFGADNESKYKYKCMYIIIMIFVLPMLSIIFMSETSLGMRELNYSTPKGRNNLQFVKYRFCMLICCIVSLLVYMAYICTIHKIYGLTDGLSNAASIPLFEQFDGMTLLVLFALTILIRIFIIQFIATIMVLFIGKSNNYIAAVGKGAVVIVVFAIIIF